MDIINFDDVDESKKQSKHYFLLPDSHYMLVGGTGQGKTNLLTNMLLKWMNYDSCKIYTLNPQQDKYQIIQEFHDVINDEIDGDLDNDICQILDPTEIIPVEDLDDEKNKIIVFDDIKIDNKNMNNVKEYFSLSRNKNCNCIYLCQSYYDVPKYIRRNTKCFVLFGGLDNKDIRHIADDNCKNISRKKFENIYNEITNEPYNFMVLDKNTKYIPEMYRKNFDGFLIDRE